MKVWRTDKSEEQVCDVCGGTTQPMMIVHKTTENHQVMGYVCQKHVDPSIVPWKLEEEAWKIVRTVESVAILVQSSEFRTNSENSSRVV